MESDFVSTDIGEVQVLTDGDGTVLVRFHPNDPNCVMARFDAGSCTLTVSRLRKPPARHSEVTQNGSTFEVLDVRPNGRGYDVLNGNTKVWEKWVED